MLPRKLSGTSKRYASFPTVTYVILTDNWKKEVSYLFENKQVDYSDFKHQTIYRKFLQMNLQVVYVVP
jgi:hypothetical protein